MDKLSKKLYANAIKKTISALSKGIDQNEEIYMGVSIRMGAIPSLCGIENKSIHTVDYLKLLKQKLKNL